MESKKAVAVKYDEEKDDAPRVIAKGRRYLAEQIILLARENDVYIKEDSELLNFLYKLEIGEEIPEELYSVVAEILAFVYRIRERWLS